MSEGGRTRAFHGFRRRSGPATRSRARRLSPQHGVEAPGYGDSRRRFLRAKAAATIRPIRAIRRVSIRTRRTTPHSGRRMNDGTNRGTDGRSRCAMAACQMATMIRASSAITCTSQWIATRQLESLADAGAAGCILICRSGFVPMVTTYGAGRMLTRAVRRPARRPMPCGRADRIGAFRRCTPSGFASKAIGMCATIWPTTCDSRGHCGSITSCSCTVCIGFRRAWRQAKEFMFAIGLTNFTPSCASNRTGIRHADWRELGDGSARSRPGDGSARSQANVRRAIRNCGGQRRFGQGCSNNRACRTTRTV